MPTIRDAAPLVVLAVLLAPLGGCGTSGRSGGIGPREDPNQQVIEYDVPRTEPEITPETDPFTPDS